MISGLLKLFEIHMPFQYLQDPLLLAGNQNPLFLVYLLPRICILLDLDRKVFCSLSNLGVGLKCTKNFMFINSYNILRLKKKEW